MAIIKEIEGNLIKLMQSGEVRIMGHGCNCFHMMGAGIALDVATHFPGATMVDKNHHDFGYDATGDFSVYEVPTGQLIYNMYTQYNGGRVKKQHDLYGAISTAVCVVAKDLGERFPDEGKRQPLHLPYIGAGIAGGDWNVIQKIIDEESHDSPVVIVKFKP